jgi:hypothetical protein
MIGYSGTPLPKKLGIIEGIRVLVLGAPEGFASTLGRLPVGAALRNDLRGKEEADVAILFVRSRKELEVGFPKVAEHMKPAGGIWIAWPKKASKVVTDMTENVAREVVLPTSWVDVKVAAIDEVWSGLRFVKRLSVR